MLTANAHPRRSVLLAPPTSLPVRLPCAARATPAAIASIVRGLASPHALCRCPSPLALLPDHWTGSLPGDVGCDPFGLAKPVEYLQFSVDQLDQNKAVNKTGEPIGFIKQNKKVQVDADSQFQPYDEVFGIERFRECEVIHGRWAMLAVLGVVTAENTTGQTWLEIGAREIDNVNYAGLELPFTIKQLSIIEVLLMGYIEVARNTQTDPELVRSAAAFARGGVPMPNHHTLCSGACAVVPCASPPARARARVRTTEFPLPGEKKTRRVACPTRGRPVDPAARAREPIAPAPPPLLDACADPRAPVPLRPRALDISTPHSAAIRAAPSTR